ncbi:iron ABC transporter permease [Nakamurella antarctica]|uniref:Iron ABC transporter permease n=1 Tax=Nakamurella antarctica TaxID=1902245 RepID=A0A3G8ZQ93_9ACTN|nr:iron ABC transporter permease [Nakamurella antarctica]AZI58965.1 iron ABC transporter permease [Nakamurella antarctica]
MKLAKKSLLGSGETRHGRTVAVLVLLAFLAAMADLMLGRGFSVPRFIPALSDSSSVEGQILRLVRLPRVATAALSGAGLGVAGLILQAVLRNPLASPELTGVNPAAVLGVIVAISFSLVRLDSAMGLLSAALIGGLLGGAISYLLTNRLGSHQLILVGVLTAAVTGGVTVLFLSLNSSQFGNVLRWLVGSVDGRTWENLRYAAPWILAWILVVALFSGVLPIIAGGDSHAAGLGVALLAARGLLLFAAVALIAGSAALAGAISFIGLGVPHIVRALVGGQSRWAVPAAALVGSILLCACDALAQFGTGIIAASDISQRAGLPAGAVAALIGAGALVWAARKLDKQ